MTESQEPRPVGIVFSGSPGRVPSALRMLRDGQISRLLISGVNSEVTLQQVLCANGFHPTLAEKIDIDFARDTIENAVLSAHWIVKNGYDNVHLITSDLHMPRARMELDDALREAGYTDEGGNLRVHITPVFTYLPYTLVQEVEEDTKKSLRERLISQGLDDSIDPTLEELESRLPKDAAENTIPESCPSAETPTEEQQTHEKPEGLMGPQKPEASVPSP